MDLRKSCRVRKLDEYDNLAHCIHISDRNYGQAIGRWGFADGNGCQGNPYRSGGLSKRDYALKHDAFGSVDSRWFDDPYAVSARRGAAGSDRSRGYATHQDQGWNSYLAHYGVKGQKWGVITKEYEPVAVDHRKIGNKSSLIQKARTRLATERAAREKEYRDTIAFKQAQREKRQKAMRIGGAVLGAGLLAIALYRGYKVSDIRPKETWKNALHSLTELRPRKGSAGRLMGAGFKALDAHERSKTMGLKKVLSTFKHAGGILTMTHYRQKIKNARNYINRFKDYASNRI